MKPWLKQLLTFSSRNSLVGMVLAYRRAPHCLDALHIGFHKWKSFATLNSKSFRCTFVVRPSAHEMSLQCAGCSCHFAQTLRRWDEEQLQRYVSWAGAWVTEKMPNARAMEQCLWPGCTRADLFDVQFCKISQEYLLMSLLCKGLTKHQ